MKRRNFLSVCSLAVTAPLAMISKSKALYSTSNASTQVIDVNEYKKKFEARCLEAGFTKLDEPVNTQLSWHCAVSVDSKVNFDNVYWELMTNSLIRKIATFDFGEFYRVDLFYLDDVLVLTCSRGDHGRENLCWRSPALRQGNRTGKPG